ncbi:Crp/Fnr family transcriptional regulator [Rhizobium giardinii]|uniref:CRP-like cAMP-binding protein n=1 Tax=Rhizobium giardinii TaxID=56731 RepID=A0A7W8UF49_9HYPH|nr:Crp/Fnr family transcriptional regulator [Rhizobium giardinii]MBB5538252.1 CRP-like cAMP-binding protein [Rhizobium giardinii]
MITIMSDLVARLNSISASTKSFDQGGSVFHQGDPIHSLYVVMSGTVHLVRHQADGAATVLQRCTAGHILAEASVYSDTYHCDAVSVSSVTVSIVPVAEIKRLLATDIAFTTLWAVHLARELQATRKRAEIVSLRTVKARLDAWLAWNEGVLPPKGAWKQLADDIGISSEALYREVAQRRVEVDTKVGRTFPQDTP